MTVAEIRMVKDLCLLEDGELSSWETDFVEDLSQRPENYVLSFKQADVLERIWEKNAL